MVKSKSGASSQGGITRTLDETDRLLLLLLQDDSELRLKHLAEKVELSVGAVSERIHRLEEVGIIGKRVAILDRDSIGLHVVAFIRVLVDSAANETRGISQLVLFPEILECHCITGEYSYLLKVCVPDTHHLESLISRCKSVEGIERCDTMLSLSTAKETTALPI